MESVSHRTLADIGPLTQPNSREIGGLIRRGLAQRATDYETSPIEAKQQRIIERYVRERGTLAAALVTLGENPDLVGEESRAAINTFINSDRSVQQQMHHDVIGGINVQLSRLFDSNRTLHQELLEELETDPDAINIKMRFWNRTFKDASRRERVNVAIQLRDGNGQMLLVRFPSYVQDWKRILIERMGYSQEEAAMQRVKLEEDFARASDLGKIGISRTLREKILDASSVSVNQGLSMLKKLRAAAGITVDSDKFPDPSRLRTLYQSSSLKGRNAINDEIKNACDTLIARHGKSKRP